MKIIKDKERIKELLERGVEKIYPSKNALQEKLLKGDRLKLYCGFDPSAPSLHIGNAIGINKLSQFQALGHEVIFLIGDFTGMIGDPTDKSAARKKLTRAEVVHNSASYQKQASAYLDFSGDNPVQVKRNSEWSDKMTFKDLIEVSSNFTVQQMITRDMFQKRLQEDKPIYLHEFLYPLAQGYDSVAMDVDLEVGGNDQMFNMLAGRDLQKAINNKEKFVMTLKLLADDKGKKMGKSEGNAVFLDQAAKDIYGAVMSWADGVIGAAFELCTKLPMKEIEEIHKQLKDGKTNPRDLKMKLAFEITKLVHGETGAQAAQDYFVKTVQKKEEPDDIKTIGITRDERLVGVLVSSELVSSYSEARRLIKQKAVKINGKVVSDVDMKISVESGEIIIQKGKRGFVRVIKT